MSTPRRVIIRGGLPSEKMFSLDPNIFGVEINWNTTRIERDAKAGLFGEPEVVPMFMMPAMNAQMEMNIDWQKVFAMTAIHKTLSIVRGEEVNSPLEIPALQVMFVAPDGKTYRTPIDGNHRICARQLLRMAFFRSYVVPEAMERSYRVTFEEIVDG